MTTETLAATESAEEKINKLRELFGDAPVVGRTALETFWPGWRRTRPGRRRRRWRALAGSGAGWAKSRS